MSGRAYLSQPRDRDGKWTDGVARGVRIGPEGGVAGRGSSAGSRAKSKRASLAALGDLHRRAMAGDQTLTRRELDQVEYASPKLIAKSRRERGTIVMPRGEVFDRARGRRNTARDVGVNPLTGKFVAEASLRRRGGAEEESAPFSRRSKSSASAARKKAATARPKLAPKPEYVGRRRAQP